MRRAGLLTEPIEILSVEKKRNDYGEETEIQKSKCNTRARVLHNKGGRKQENQEITYIYNKVFLVRYYVDIADFDLIRWNGKKYRVLDIEPDKVRQEKTIYTEQINE